MQNVGIEKMTIEFKWWCAGSYGQRRAVWLARMRCLGSPSMAQGQHRRSADPRALACYSHDCLAPFPSRPTGRLASTSPTTAGTLSTWRTSSTAGLTRHACRGTVLPGRGWGRHGPAALHAALTAPLPPAFLLQVRIVNSDNGIFVKWVDKSTFKGACWCSSSELAPGLVAGVCCGLTTSYPLSFARRHHL